jgi:histone deacetylase 1/2
LYVDDIILTASTTTLLHGIISFLNFEFAMSDLGLLHHFLGVNVHRTSHGLFLLEWANMLNYNPIATPIDTKCKLFGQDGHTISHPSLYRSPSGALQYLTLTRPDLSYAIQQACLSMHYPREAHFQLVKQTLCYVKATAHLGLQLHTGSLSELAVYSDVDWAGYPNTCKSTSSFCVFLGINLVSWYLIRLKCIYNF